MTDFRLPLAPAVDQLTVQLSVNLAAVFDTIAAVILGIELPIERAILLLPAWAVVVIVTAIGAILGGRWFALVCAASLVFIISLDLWEPAVSTFALVLTATALALIIGIPIGLLMGESRCVTAVMTPILDFMQTMPAFVLLIPSVLFFGVGTVAGVVATVIYAMPPAVRLTAHGLTMVEAQMVEAGEAFGCNRSRLLVLVKIPLAFRTIMAGVNQCIMMALSMVVISSMIGAGGLGEEIVRAISRLQVGRGVEAGLAVVVLAILLDRISKQLGERIDPTR
jgi:ABC-type proline/glycine betaine transport system permease subunit